MSAQFQILIPTGLLITLLYSALANSAKSNGLFPAPLNLAEAGLSGLIICVMTAF
ncbi:MAG: hypothetical protein IT297_11115 [Anaerolineae bacterium]|jgi:hypothetical protein|nr:hypothetical protein [Anaerolineae bacterium]MCZ7551602.1 hypothetical protein [Anaerolineales bacterium]